MKCIKSLGNGKWMARTTVLVDGVPKRQEKRFTTGTSGQNKQAAQDWAHNHERIRSGLAPTFPRVTNLGELVEFYLGWAEGEVKDVTLEGYAKNLRCLLSAFGSSHPFYLSQWEVNDYVRQRRSDGVGRGIIKELGTLRYALHAIGITPEWSVPTKLYRLPKRQMHTPSIMEFKTLVNTCSPPASLALLMAVFAGLRDAEVFRVKWDDYTQSERILRITPEIRKNKVGNLIPVVSSLGSKLDTLQLKDDTGEMIPFPSSTRKEIKKTSGGKISGLQPFRRLLVETALDSGYDHDSIALVTGHSRGSMVSKYSTQERQMDLKRMILEDVEQRLIA